MKFILLRAAPALLAAIAACYAANAQAGPLEEGFSSSVYSRMEQYTKDIRSAFYRSQVRMDVNTGARPLAPSSFSGLFPQYGFISSFPGVSTQISSISPEVSSVCITYSSSSAANTEGAAGALFDAGYYVSASGCNSPGNTRFKGVVYGYRLLDTQDVPSYSLLSEKSLSYTGPSLDTFIRPSFTLRAPPGAPGETISLPFYNPSTVSFVAANGQAYCEVRGVTSANVRGGFKVDNQCSSIQPGGSCAVYVQYGGTTGAGYPYLVGSLALSFSDGGFMRVNLLGVPDKDLKASSSLSASSGAAASQPSYAPVPCPVASSTSPSTGTPPGKPGKPPGTPGKPPGTPGKPGKP
jgi:hypothetical protein